MSVVGWIFTAGVFVFGMAATYPVAGPGGSLLSGGFLALMYLARVAIHTRPSAPSEPIALNAYGRAALANLVDAFARAPDDDMRGHDLVRRGRAPSGKAGNGALGCTTPEAAGSGNSPATRSSTLPARGAIDFPRAGCNCG